MAELAALGIEGTSRASGSEGGNREKRREGCTAHPDHTARVALIPAFPLSTLPPPSSPFPMVVLGGFRSGLPPQALRLPCNQGIPTAP